MMCTTDDSKMHLCENHGQDALNRPEQQFLQFKRGFRCIQPQEKVNTEIVCSLQWLPYFPP
jgi:hypothetical protein